MDENTEKTEYLTVKDVAALVRRNEETIRRMIRARKLDVASPNLVYRSTILKPQPLMLGYMRV